MLLLLWVILFLIALAVFRRLQRPNVYLPVHLYGQLVHDKTGCHLLEAQVIAWVYFTLTVSFQCSCKGDHSSVTSID